MKRIALAGVIAGIGVLGLAGAASAADIARRPAPAPVYKAPELALYNWTGLYVGINGGWGWGRSDFSGAPSTGGSFNTDGGLFGATVGYNWQFGSPLVVGLETDIDWSGNRGNAACGIGIVCETRNDYLGTVRGRLGYAAWNGVMPYVTGGLAYGNIKTSATALGGTDRTKAGWTLGAGAEFALTGPLTAKIEYLYTDLGSASGPLASDVSFRTNIIRAGLNYRF